jgi:hypothetical protein
MANQQKVGALDLKRTLTAEASILNEEENCAKRK